MKFYFYLITLVLSTSIHAQLTSIEQKALLFSEYLVNQEADSAYVMLSSEITSQINKGKIRELFPQIEGQMGKLEYRDRVRQVEENQFQVTYQPFHFKSKTLDLKLVFNQNEIIGGFFFVPHKNISLTLVDTTLFYEEEIEVFTDKTFRLRGIGTFPKTDETVSALVLVHGSGPHDLDETVGPNKLFRDIAHGLASHGIAVIRYDKRTYTYAGRPEMDIQSLTLKEETIDDAISAVNLAASDKRIDKKQIYVLGHSLGGMAVPKIAEQSKRVAGIIILAGNARPLEQLLTEQYEYLFGLDDKIEPQEKQALTDLNQQIINLNELKESGTTTGSLPLNLPKAYWQYLLNYNPVKTCQDLNKPVLILQGKRDYQVTIQDFELWKEKLKGYENVQFKLYDKLNHMMQEGVGKSTPDEYEKLSSPPSYLIEDIANWIRNQKTK
jgi:hypothetical protein